MNLYLIEDETVTKRCRQLLKLGAECAKLQWSKIIDNIPNEVLEATATIQSFVEVKIQEDCNEEALVGTLSNMEEQCMLDLLKKSNVLRMTLGEGVVFAGVQAQEVKKELRNINELKKISDALDSGKNLIIL